MKESLMHCPNCQQEISVPLEEAARVMSRHVKMRHQPNPKGRRKKRKQRSYADGSTRVGESLYRRLMANIAGSAGG